MSGLQIERTVQGDLHSVSALAKTQLYLLGQYNSGENEPWCYHTQFSYHLQIKNLSIPLFHKAIRAVLERHPVLKTVLLFDAPVVMQAVNPRLPLNITFQDISPMPPAAQAGWLEQYLLEDRNRPIDVHNQHQPLFRTYLIKRSSDSLQFVLVFKHAIWDGWSLAVLLKEIFAHYQALKLNPTLSLQPAAYDYLDFLQYETDISNTPQAREFWNNHLGNHQPFTPARIKTMADYNRYIPVERMLPAGLAESLLLAQRRLMVTMKAIFVAPFIRMVEQETKLAHNTIGMVTNGRNVQLKNPLSTLGLLWNFAPLCVRKSPDGTEHLKLVNQSLSEVAPHGSYPLLDIIDGQGGNPLFHAAFNYINFEGANLLPSGSDIEFLEVGGLDKFHFPLHLLVGKNPFNKNISLILNYDTRHYTAVEVKHKLDLYIEGLQAISNLTKN